MGRERAGDNFTTQWSSVQMHSSDLWQLAQELEAVKWPQCNAVPNNSSLWALAQHLFTSCLLISGHYSTASKGCPCSNWSAKQFLCFVPAQTLQRIHLKSDPPVWSQTNHWASLGHSFPRVSWAMVSSGCRSERWCPQDSEAHKCSAVRHH